MNWVDSIRSIKDRWASGKPRFRNGVSKIGASTIGNQYYCEQKVEMEYTAGKIETEKKTAGTALHSILLAMKKTTPDEVIKEIQTKDVYYASFPLLANFSELVLTGKPDVVIFVKGSPLFVVELKTTGTDISKLWPNQLVQARVYGLLLQEMGFDCSRLKLAVISHRRNGDISGEYRRKFLDSMVKLLVKEREDATGNRGDFHVHLIDYAKEDAVANVKWAEDYWLSKRQPISARNVGKCRSCEYVDTCPASLVKPTESSPE